MASVAERVTKIIIDRLNVEESKVVSGASFKDDLAADSLEIADLLMEFEDEFNQEISDEEAEQIKTVGDAISFIEEKVK